MHIQHLNPPELFNSTEFGFSQIVVAKPGKLVFISGQVAWNENRTLEGAGDMAGQARKAFENLRTAIEKVGGTMKDIVMLRIYVVDYNESFGTVIGNELRRCFGTVTPPASTWVGVQSLADPGFMLEIEAQAVVEGKGSRKSMKNMKSMKSGG
jgi:enamine deaminase RidA (YjgF/YER057c/UK114 family)